MLHFLSWFLLVASIMGLGYLLGVRSAIMNSEAIEQFCIEEHSGNEQHTMTFSCCPKHNIKEAFQVSGENIPLWAFSPKIDIYISPVRKVVVHKENGYNVVAQGTDYLIHDQQGDFYACPAELFESSYSYVSLK